MTLNCIINNIFSYIGNYIDHCYEVLSAWTEQHPCIAFWLLYGLIPLLLCILIVYICIRKKRASGSSLLLPAFITFVCGIIIYCIGFFNEGTEETCFALLGRSTISSMEMFVSHSDLIEVRSTMKENALYMVCFALIHIMAICLTMLAAIGVLGNKFRYLKRRKISKWFGGKRPLYIFFGVNEASIITAQKIHEDSKGKQRIVFIEFPEEKGEHINFESLIGLSSIKHGLAERIKKIGNDVILCYGETKISEVEAVDPRKKREVEQAINNKGYFSIFDKIGVSDIKKYIKKADEVKIFFLSEDQQDNLRSFEALCSDPYILGNKINKKDNIGLEGPKFVIYCHARRDNQNVVYENDYIEVNKVEVHIIDTSLLAIHYLKSNLRYCPISFVEHENGVVTSDFNSMIIGFGETGRDAFDFLYEFGSFEGINGKRSGFHCLVIDEKMDEIRDSFLASKPALRERTDILELSDMQPRSESFWKCLSHDIKKMNYIVIALGNDEKSISLAIDIYNFAIKVRGNNLDKFRIFVRVYEYENEKRMNNIANYYNANNPITIRKTYPNFIDMQEEYNEGDDGTIVIFGELDEIFNLHYIYNEDEKTESNGVIINAKSFYSAYRSLEKESEKILSEEKAWKTRREECISDDDIKLFALKGLKRKESQDMSNSLHINTKMQLLGLVPMEPISNPGKKAELMSKIDKYLLVAKNFQSGSAIPQGEESIYNLIISLAKTEHYRWVAAQESLGYTPSENIGQPCNEIEKTHGSMYSWEELNSSDTDVIKFDFKVIETSLKIKKRCLDSLKLDE